MPFSLIERNDVVPFIYSEIGALSVMIFFVLSGFLITYSIDENLKKTIIRNLMLLSILNVG